MPSEASPRQRGEQDRRDWTIADLLTVVRIPLAVAFPLVSNGWRFVVLATAAATDLLDGQLARRFGSSRFGAVIHELTHLAAHTQDHAYGRTNARTLALKEGTRAANNADTYEYFCETLSEPPAAR